MACSSSTTGTNHAAVREQRHDRIDRRPALLDPMEYYENGGSATARLLWSHASIAKAPVPASRLFPATPTSAIRINFQLASAPVPAGYLPDGGLVYGARGQRPDLRLECRQHRSGQGPQLDPISRSGLRHADPHAGAGESERQSGKSRCRTAPTTVAHGQRRRVVLRQRLPDRRRRRGGGRTGRRRAQSRWVEGTATVTVADGRLTLTNAAGASNNKICFIEITPR